MRIEPELGSCSVVLLGHFNPLIFSPLWFAQNKIVSETQATDAEVTVINPQITVCKIGKFQIQADYDRFAADTAEAPWIDLSDFVTRTFGLLIHTPINQMGINRLVHFSVGNEETRNRIGNLLAPFRALGRMGKGDSKGQGGRAPGWIHKLNNVTTEGTRPDERSSPGASSAVYKN